MKQVELMTERCLIPVRVFELMVKSKEIMVRGTKDRISSNRYILKLIIRAISQYPISPNKCSLCKKICFSIKINNYGCTVNWIPF